MARRNPPRWLLGASVLGTLVVAGCGATTSHPRNALDAGHEQRLLSLIARARDDAANRNPPGVHTALVQFLTEVNNLHVSGELTAATATSLTHQALATEAQAARLLSSAQADDAAQAKSQHPAAAASTSTAPGARTVLPATAATTPTTAATTPTTNATPPTTAASPPAAGSTPPAPAVAPAHPNPGPTHALPNPSQRPAGNHGHHYGWNKGPGRSAGWRAGHV